MHAPTHRASPRRAPSRWWGRLAALLAGLLLASPVWGASFQVSPTRFEFSLDKRFTNFFIITNNAETTLRIRVYPRFIELDEANKPTEKADHPYDLSRWMVFNPRLLTVRPGQKRIIRFSVRPPKDVVPGEYRTVVFFEELPSPPDENGRPGEQDGVALQLKLLTRLGVTLYGMKGKPQPAAKFLRDRMVVEQGKLRFALLFENTGNVHLPLTVEARLYDPDGDLHKEATNVVMLQRGQRQRWRFEAQELDQGTYRLEVRAAADQLEVTQLQVSVPVGTP